MDRHVYMRCTAVKEAVSKLICNHQVTTNVKHQHLIIEQMDAFDNSILKALSSHKHLLTTLRN